jgi:protein-tyrosine phosphatase
VLPAPLHLDWPGCLNARDLGGLPTADGGTIRERALVRTDSHSFLTEDGLAAARAYRPSRIIDLRFPTECAEWPSRLAADPAYLNLPVQIDEDGVGDLPPAEVYRAWLDRGAERFAAVLASIAEAPPGPVVVHCAAGKDRTGLVVALALSLAGVPDEEIAADYLLTNERLASRYEELIEQAADEAERQRWIAIRWAEPSYILESLQHLRDVHGGVEAYLLTAGLTDAQLNALRDRLR